MSFADRLTKLRAAALAFVIAAGLGLAACGGDDDSSDSSSADTTSSTTSESSSDQSSGDASDVRAQFDDLLQENLTGQQGLDSAVADCVVKELQANVTDEQIQEVIDSGSLTPEVTKAATAAGIKCAQAGG
jgi:hypothetical protein